MNSLTRKSKKYKLTLSSLLIPNINSWHLKIHFRALKLDLIFKSILVFLLIIDLLQIFILILHLLLTLTIISIIIIIIHLSFHVNQLRTIIKSILTITIMRMLISLNNINSFLIIRRKCKIRRIMWIIMKWTTFNL